VVGVVHPIGNPVIQRDDADLQHVARGGAFDIDRSGQDMGAGALGMRHLAVDIDDVLEHLVGRDAASAEEGDRIVRGVHAAMGDGVDAHRLPRPDAQDRRRIGGEITPDDRFRRRTQRRVRGRAGRRRLRGGGKCKDRNRGRDGPAKQGFGYAGHSVRAASCHGLKGRTTAARPRHASVSPPAGGCRAELFRVNAGDRASSLYFAGSTE